MEDREEVEDEVKEEVKVEVVVVVPYLSDSRHLPCHTSAPSHPPGHCVKIPQYNVLF